MRQLMQSTPDKRRNVVLIAAVLAIVTLFALASGLESVRLEPAESYVVVEDTGDAQPAVRLSQTIAKMDPGVQLLAIFVLIVVMVVMFVILFRKDPKRAFMILLRLGLQLLFVYLIVTYYNQQIPANILPEGPPAPASVGPSGSATPVEYVAPEMPTWFVFAVSFAVMSIVGGVGWLLWRFLRPQKPTLQDDLARIARRTLQDLESGHEWGDAVVRCYVEMSEALDHQRGITRVQSMTPSEFIAHIGRYGLPLEPVRTLTRLFERVRYGGRASGPEESSQAVYCLNQIVAACEVRS